jgi:hypothetical protein
VSGVRHFGTLIAAILFAPLAWVLLAFGEDRTAMAFANAHANGAFHSGDFLRPLQYLTAAGLLLGLLATLRFSPLGTVVAGLLYASSYFGLLFAPQSVVNLFTHHVSIGGHQADLTLPIRTGTAMLLGALMLVGAASLGRWRRWPRPGSERTRGEYRTRADYRGDYLGEDDRPVGVDGLGLLPPSRGGKEPELVRHTVGPTRPATPEPEPAAWGQATWDTGAREPVVPSRARARWDDRLGDSTTGGW